MVKSAVRRLVRFKTTKPRLLLSWGEARLLWQRRGRHEREISQCSGGRCVVCVSRSARNKTQWDSLNCFDPLVVRRHVGLSRVFPRRQHKSPGQASTGTGSSSSREEGEEERRGEQEVEDLLAQWHRGYLICFPMSLSRRVLSTVVSANFIH